MMTFKFNLNAKNRPSSPWRSGTNRHGCPLENTCEHHHAVCLRTDDIKTQFLHAHKCYFFPLVVAAATGVEDTFD